MERHTCASTLHGLLTTSTCQGKPNQETAPAPCSEQPLCWEPGRGACPWGPRAACRLRQAGPCLLLLLLPWRLDGGPCCGQSQSQGACPQGRAACAAAWDPLAQAPSAQAIHQAWETCRGAACTREASCHACWAWAWAVVAATAGAGTLPLRLLSAQVACWPLS